MYYDHEVQAWVEDGFVQPCEHKTPMAGCAGCKYPGMNIEDVHTALLMQYQRYQIHIYKGRKGAGKTLATVIQAVTEAAESGIQIVSDIPLFGLRHKRITNLAQIGNLDIRDSLIICNLVDTRDEQPAITAAMDRGNRLAISMQLLPEKFADSILQAEIQRERDTKMRVALCKYLTGGLTLHCDGERYAESFCFHHTDRYLKYFVGI